MQIYKIKICFKVHCRDLKDFNWKPDLNCETYEKITGYLFGDIQHD